MKTGPDNLKDWVIDQVKAQLPGLERQVEAALAKESEKIVSAGVAALAKAVESGEAEALARARELVAKAGAKVSKILRF